MPQRRPGGCAYRRTVRPQKEIDLVEELVRLRGYPTHPGDPSEHADPDRGSLQGLEYRRPAPRAAAGAGYFEAITYSFIRHEDWQLFAGDNTRWPFQPISREWPSCARHSGGADQCVGAQPEPQVSSLRLFELGMVFIPETASWSRCRNLPASQSAVRFPSSGAQCRVQPIL